MSEPRAKAGKVSLPLVSGGTVDLLPGVAMILADGGRTAGGEAITEVSNRRGYVWRVRMEKAAVAEALAFGEPDAARAA